MIIRMPITKQRTENIKRLKMLINQYVKTGKQKAFKKIKKEQ